MTIWFPLWQAPGSLALSKYSTVLKLTTILYCDWLSCLAHGRQENKWLKAWRYPTLSLLELLLTTSCQNRNCQPAVVQTGPYQPACFRGPHFLMFCLWRQSREFALQDWNTERQLSWTKFSLLSFDSANYFLFSKLQLNFTVVQQCFWCWWL